MTLNSLTPFEQRRRRIRPHKRDQVQFGQATVPELLAWLQRAESDLRNQVSLEDPVCADFLEWYEEEYKKYGPPIRPGLAALYWRWAQPSGDGHLRLTPEEYAARRQELAGAWAGAWLDNEYTSSRTLVQEFIWWSSNDWLLQTTLIDALDEFSAYYASGKMPDWRRKKRRRLAAARRKEIKQQYERQRLELLEQGEDQRLPQAA